MTPLTGSKFMLPFALPNRADFFQCLFISLVVLACVIVFAVYLTGGLPSMSALFLPEQVGRGLPLNAWWKIWTPSFIHFDFFHMLSNLVLWCYLGAKIERESKSHIMSLFLLGALLGNLLQWWLAGPQFGGMSGVVFSLFGYRLVAFWGFKRKDFALEQSFVGFFFLYFVITSMGMLGNYAVWAHVGGFLAGALVALFYWWPSTENTNAGFDV